MYRTLSFPAAALVAIGGMFVSACGDDAASTRACPNEPGVICPWAGTGAPGFDGDRHALLESRFYWPADVTFTGTGDAYILDWNNHRVRLVMPDGTLETVIGTDEIGDGPPAAADLTPPGVPGTTVDLNHPTALVEMEDGALLLVAWHNHKLRRYDPETGLVTVLCGRGAGFDGDGPIEDARLNQPVAAAYGPDGELYLLDQRNQRIRRIGGFGAGDVIETVVGTGVAGFAGDGGSPLEAQVSFPAGSNPPPGGGIAVGPDGRLYFADILNNRIRRVDLEADRIETVLGDGTAAALNNPRDIEFGPDGRLYVADERNHRVLALDVDTLAVEVVAGTGVAGDTGDFGPAVDAQLNMPCGVAFDPSGDLVVADSTNHRFRLVRLGGDQ